MTPLPQSDAPSQEINTPITVRLPAVLQSTGAATPYSCELVIPITLKIPLLLQIEVLTQPPQCQTQEQVPRAQPIASALPSIPNSSSAQYFVRPPDHTTQPLDHTTQQVPIRLAVQKIGWLLGVILRYLRPNHTVTLILLGALLGTTCSSIVVMQRLGENATQPVEKLKVQ